MAKRRVFYSFHYEKDVMRASQIRNIGVIERNTPVSDNDWETVKRGGDIAIKRWIDDNMSGCSCLVVLIGENTAERKWVRYEIENGKGVLGIYIHNIKCARDVRDGGSGLCHQGNNPFDYFTLKNNGQKLSYYVRCFNPKSYNAYNDISNSLENLVNEAIANRQNI
jgi:hypothetical protein